MYGGIGYLAPSPSHPFGGKHRRVDLKVYPRSEWPFAILYFTGSKSFNRAMRLYANKKCGMRLSDKALQPCVSKGKEKVLSGPPIPCETEEDIFKALGLSYVPPTQRDTIPDIML
jgi:DNA polymerase/3'-5' exonuclease PolX